MRSTGRGRARRDWTVLVKMAAPLSIGPADLPQAVDRLQAEAKASQKERLEAPRRTGGVPRVAIDG